MSFTSWSTRIRHDTDATYQEWRDEWITKLGILVAGGVIAADETNITPGAGTKPTTNTEGHYAVYHISDSLHGTAPIYIRFGFGSHSGGATSPRVQVTVGTSTNGSGVLGGTALTTIRSCGGSAAQVTDTTRTSYFSAAAGFFGLNWKAGSGTTESMFFVARSVDTSGVITATGAMVVWGAGSSSSITTQALRFASTAVAYTAQTSLTEGALAFNAQAPTTSTVGSDNQYYLCWTITPAMVPLIQLLGVYDTDVPQGNTFTKTPFGSTSRTYIGLSTITPAGVRAANGASGLKFAMLWE